CRRLNDPSIIEREQQSRRAPGNDRIDGELSAARKRLSEIVRAQERVLARYSESDIVPWDLVEREIQRGEREKEELRRRITELERDRQQRIAVTKQLAHLRTWCERVAGNLEGMTFEEKRKVLEILAVRVEASGFEYQPIKLDPQVF
ncbi:MAG TPA: hypothetical protein VEX37_02685, partial [Thermomicrobiales bacterium]|nr:hypothetical protein [Thermomicrobiales bacterium]